MVHHSVLIVRYKQIQNCFDKICVMIHHSAPWWCIINFGISTIAYGLLDTFTGFWEYFNEVSGCLKIDFNGLLGT